MGRGLYIYEYYMQHISIIWNVLNTQFMCGETVRKRRFSPQISRSPPPPKKKNLPKLPRLLPQQFL